MKDQKTKKEIETKEKDEAPLTDEELEQVTGAAFGSMWVEKEEFEESGASIVH